MKQRQKLKKKYTTSRIDGTAPGNPFGTVRRGVLIVFSGVGLLVSVVDKLL
jgi:hypothetical protein